MTKPGQTYKIRYLKSVLKKDIPALSKSVAKNIKSVIETRVMVNPIEFGKPLQYNMKGYRRLRVASYRIVYKLDGELITIAAIKHRKEVYNK
jgi:mRNA interferase RelE/StbE